jgi:hypothetical protein
MGFWLWAALIGLLVCSLPVAAVFEKMKTRRPRPEFAPQMADDVAEPMVEDYQVPEEGVDGFTFEEQPRS